MRTAVQIAIPVILPRAAVLWALVRLIVAVAPLAAGGAFGSVPASPIGVVVLCGFVGLIDVHRRGERVLWANLGVPRRALYVMFAASAIPAECLLALIRR
jgi:hypothetical protein